MVRTLEQTGRINRAESDDNSPAKTDSGVYSIVMNALSFLIGLELL
jgi:hypothetical protein